MFVLLVHLLFSFPTQQSTELGTSFISCKNPVITKSLMSDLEFDKFYKFYKLISFVNKKEESMSIM